MPINRIHPLDYLPKHMSEEYDRDALLSSIKNKDLQNPLVVARHPEQEKYYLIAGGNHRLDVLKEIHSEADGFQYSEIPVLIREWPGEVEGRLQHLITNDVKQEFSFVEHAESILYVVDQYLLKETAQKLSQKEIADLLTTAGYPISRVTYSLMHYTIAVLLPLIPNLLYSGLERDYIRQIRKIDESWRKKLAEQSIDLDQYEEIFKEIVQVWDGEHWDLFLFQEDLEEALTANFALTGSSSVRREDPSNGNSQQVDCAARIPEQELPAEIEKHTPIPLGQLRRTNRQLALKLAQRFEIEHWVKNNGNVWAGFKVKDFENAELTPAQNRLWNFFRVCTDFEAAESQLHETNDASTVSDDGDQQIEADIPSLDVDHENNQIDLELALDVDNESWEEIVQIWEATRQIRERIFKTQQGKYPVAVTELGHDH